MYNAIFSNGVKKVQENFDNVQELNDGVIKYSDRGFLHCILTTPKGSYNGIFFDSWEFSKFN